MAGKSASIDFRLLSLLTDLLLCSRCLRLGRRTPIPQVVSRRHRPRSLCDQCKRAESDGRPVPASIAFAGSPASDC
jgi:hypothetical protein